MHDQIIDGDGFHGSSVSTGARARASTRDRAKVGGSARAGIWAMAGVGRCDAEGGLLA